MHKLFILAKVVLWFWHTFVVICSVRHIPVCDIFAAGQDQVVGQGHLRRPPLVALAAVVGLAVHDQGARAVPDLPQVVTPVANETIVAETRELIHCSWHVYLVKYMQCSSLCVCVCVCVLITVVILGRGDVNIIEFGGPGGGRESRHIV